MKRKEEMEDSMMIKRCMNSSTREKVLVDLLPSDILKLIFKRLYYIDQINFHAVCKSLYSMDKIQPLNPVPWRLGFDSRSCTIRDPACNKIHIIPDINIKEKKLYSMPVHDTKCGWMLMSSKSYEPTTGYSFLLYAPLLVGMNNIIDLPFLNTEFRMATFSSNPLHEDCLFLALNQNPHCRDHVVSISTCRRGDQTWRTQNFECDVPLHHVKNAVYFEGIFYCPIFDEAIIWTYNVAQQNWVALAPGKSTLISYRQKGRCQRHIHRIQTDHDGELVLVLFDHLQLPACSHFYPWSYFPGSHVPKLGLSEGARRKEKSINLWELVRRPDFRQYVNCGGRMEED